MEKAIRVTKAQRFEDIKALLSGNVPQYGTTVNDAISALNHEIEMLVKKNANTGEKKPTANQIANEKFKELIVNFLATIPEDSDGVTCTEILKNIPEINENFQVQKVAVLVRQLVQAGRVSSKEVKGKALFSLC